jgi:CRISPR-associated endonuclease/helicase Cas3
MLVKMLLSCIVDADRLDAYLFEISPDEAEYAQLVEEQLEHERAIVCFEELSERLERYLRNYEKRTYIDEIRADISDRCLDAAKKARGIYRLQVPTGGGKTLSSLRFALAHAKAHGLERVVYVIPYLSIIEQTADKFYEVLGTTRESGTILEHHSNVIFEDKDTEETEHKLLTSRWDSPIIITTMVQFLESVFSAKSGDLRKLHNFSKSVFIFDEVQSLPLKTTYMFNEAMNFLVDCAGSSALLCSATQPLLDEVEEHFIRMASEPSIIDEELNSKFTALKRTKICKLGKLSISGLADFALEQLEKNGSCLVIVNKKKSAALLYRAVKERFPDARHLSTAMCQAHREAVIGKVKDDLKEKRPVLCISTQLIEAGVDISFGCVIRELAGLDSIAQAAGRCNRNGEYGETRAVYVVELEGGGSLEKLKDIQEGAECAERIFRELEKGYYGDKDALSEEVMDSYYKYYFAARDEVFAYPRSMTQNQNSSSRRSFRKHSSSLYDLLSKNNLGTRAAESRRISLDGLKMHQAFKTAGEEFEVIDRGRRDVVVEGYNKCVRKLSEKYLSADLAERRKLLPKLSRYSVSLYEWEFENLSEKIRFQASEDGVLFLPDGFYGETGFDLGGSLPFLDVWKG